MSEEDKKWSQLPLTELRFVAKKYKQFHSLGNISKAKKSDLIMTLKKFMMFEGDAIKQKPNATPIATTGTKEAPAPKAKKPKAPAPPPAPAVMGDKGYKKMVKKVKDPKKQMEGASADAKAVAEQMKTMAKEAKAMGHTVAEHKAMSKPASMPMKTNSGASASSAPTKTDASKILAKFKKNLTEYKKNHKDYTENPHDTPARRDEMRKTMEENDLIVSRYYGLKIDFEKIKSSATKEEIAEFEKALSQHEMEGKRLKAVIDAEQTASSLKPSGTEIRANVKSLVGDALMREKKGGGSMTELAKMLIPEKKKSKNKPASMPMMTDSGASASSAPVYNERVIKVLTNYFDTTTQEKQITKFINENIKTEDDLLKWLKIFESSIGNKDSIASWRINDDVFGGKNTPEAIKFQKYKFNKTSEGEDDNEWNVKEKIWRLFRGKIASKKQKRSNTYDPNF